MDFQIDLYKQSLQVLTKSVVKITKITNGKKNLIFFCKCWRIKYNILGRVFEKILEDMFKFVTRRCITAVLRSRSRSEPVLLVGAGAVVTMWRQKHFLNYCLAYFYMKRSRSRSRWKKGPGAGAGQKRNGSATLCISSTVPVISMNWGSTMF